MNQTIRQMTDEDLKDLIDPARWGSDTGRKGQLIIELGNEVLRLRQVIKDHPYSE